MSRKGKRTKRRAQGHAGETHPQDSKRFLLANGAAALFVFLSWLGQNIYQGTADSARSDVELKVAFINSEMMKVISWTQMFQKEIRQESVDPEIVLNSTKHHALSIKSIIEAAASVDPESKILSSHLAEFRKLYRPFQAEIEGRSQSRDPAALQNSVIRIIAHSQRLMTWFDEIGPEARAAIQRRYDSVHQEANKWRWAFIASYMIGSVILAITWAIVFLDKHPL